MTRNPPQTTPCPAASADSHRSITILSTQDVAAQLVGRERELIDLAAGAYVTHGRGESCLPQSEYLRFPGKERERIIPKAGYLGGAHPAAGIKWISSFPDNVSRGLPRASALIILNSLQTGRPTTVMEGSMISCQRTAAGAALAARLLHGQARVATLGLLGCGPIGAETLRFILADKRPVDSLLLFDLNPAAAQALAAAFKQRGFVGDVSMASSAQELLARSDLLVLATSAVKPSLESLSGCPPQATLLHVSLRDFSVEAVLQADNLADDIDHVLQAQTSAHRTEQQTGNRGFLRGTLADVIEGRVDPRVDARPVMYHPFGLAALDLAFAQFVAEQCAHAGLGMQVPDFLP